MSEEILQTPGDVRIKKLILAKEDGTSLDILDYLIELNLYESIFSPTLTGSITLGDSRNLIQSFPLLGEEILFFEATTPSSGVSIEKAFRLHSIVEKNYATEGATQVYTIQFTSVELFRDISNPIYRSFEGTPSEIVGQIFEEYLRVPRNVEGLNKNLTADSSYTPLFLFSASTNLIKFVSPGWTPIQCINWLCAHAEPYGEKAADFLFWESNKSFYFGTIEDIISIKDEVNAGTYYYSAAMMNSDASIQSKMMAVRDISFKKLYDQLQNKMEGFLSSRLTTVDLINKRYDNYDYDYTNNFGRYNHLETDNAIPLHSTNTSRNPLVHRMVNYSLPDMFTGFTNNYSESFKFVYGNRRSNIMRLNNLIIKLVIPGRTDLEAGSVIDLILPRGFPNSPEDTNTNARDPMYSGKYLITSINHKFNPITHFITMNVTKDSLSNTET